MSHRLSQLSSLFWWIFVCWPCFFLSAQVAQSLNAFVVNNNASGGVSVLNILPELNTTATASPNPGAGGGVNLVANIPPSAFTSDVLTGVAVTPNGQYAYVITSTSPYRVYQINAVNYAVTQVLPNSYTLNQPVAIVASLDGLYIYLSDNNGGGTSQAVISQITVSSNMITAQLIMTNVNSVHSICCNNSTLFVASSNAGSAIVAQVPIAPFLGGSSAPTTFTLNGVSSLSFIGQIAIAPNTNFLYYLTGKPGPSNIYEIDVSSPLSGGQPSTPISTTSLGSSGGWQIAFAGSTAYVTSNAASVLGYFSVPSGSLNLVSNFTAPGSANSVAITADPSGKLLYTTLDGNAQLNIINVGSHSQVGTTQLTSAITTQPISSSFPLPLIAIAPTPVSKVQSSIQAGLPGITGKITSSVSPGGTIAATVTNNTGRTVYITLATYTVGSALGSGSASNNWLDTQTLSTPTSFQTFAVASGFSGALPGVTLTYPASGGFQVDLYQGTDAINWAGAPVNGIVNLNLLDAQFKYP